MTTTVIKVAAPGRGVSKSTAAALVLAALVATMFVVGAAFPYFGLNQERFGTYWPRRWWLLLHISGGIAALLSGPVQLWLGLSDRRMDVHRRLGTAYVAMVAISAAAAYYLAFNTDVGWVFGAGLAALATAWVLTTGMAWIAARRYLYDQHREWMIRSYVVTFAFVLFRITQPALGAAGIGTLQDQLVAAAWLCWSVPLLITEVVLQGRKILSVAR